MIGFFQNRYDFIHRLFLHIRQCHDHPGRRGIAPKLKHMVNFILGERKSRGRLALCFINKVNLFRFGKEKVQT